MSRGMTTGQLALLYAQTADDPLIGLLTISHDDLTTRRYAAPTPSDVTSGGNVFTAAAFDLVLPEEQAGAPSAGRLVFDAVDQTVITDLVALTTPATVVIQVVFESSPSTVVGTWTLEARRARWDIHQAEVELHPYPVLDEPYPGPTYSPGRFPGLFK